MAKKRRKHEEEKEEKEYKAPDFDEREFLTNEMETGKVTILAAIMSIPMAILAFLLMGSMGASIGLSIGILGVGLVYFLLPLLKIDPKEFKPKNWLGPVSTYIFAFLAIWVLLVNPPFNDYAGPQFISIDTEIGGESFTILGVANNSTNNVRLHELRIDSGDNISIDTKITDNENMGTVSIQIGNNDIQVMSPNPDNHYTYEITGATVGMTITITAEDTSGNQKIYEISLLQK
ncbi:MAG: hypothetical protein KAS16_03990 [Thermoplasmata archaeon]|nr:hypothetical protein [Thermoplasmata archaeon]